MIETVEHNNRFYKQPDGKLLTENEQLKEWLKIANKSNDYFREENVRLINREKELLREIHNKINEIERLNNIINELEKWLEEQHQFIIEIPAFTKEISIEHKTMEICYENVLDKIQELKGSDEE